jgi:beta-glucanase (GH16 family)
MRKACSHLRSIIALTTSSLLLATALLFYFSLSRHPQAIIYWAGESAEPGASGEAGVLPVGQHGNWTMIFHDEFNGTTLDTTKWTTCYFNFTVGNGCVHDQNELELYRPEDVIVSNGTLKLRAEKRDITASNGKIYHYTSGMVSTGPTASNPNHSRFSFQYGYMEMRAKIPAGQGMWPAFWALPTDRSWPPEIDVFEILGNAPQVINMHYHYVMANGGNGDSGGEWTGPDFSADWHTYAVDWEPHAIIWYVDGIERRRYTSAANIVSKPMYLIANLAVGGDWPGPPDTTTPFPSDFEINYIRVWKSGSSVLPASTAVRITPPFTAVSSFSMRNTRAPVPTSFPTLALYCLGSCPTRPPASSPEQSSVPSGTQPTKIPP